MPTFGPIYVFVILSYLVLIGVICVIVAHVAIAMAVYRDAERLKSSPIELAPWVWALFSFAMPAVGLLSYWLIHHSTLSKK